MLIFPPFFYTMHASLFSNPSGISSNQLLYNKCTECIQSAFYSNSNNKELDMGKEEERQKSFSSLSVLPLKSQFSKKGARW